MDADMKRYVRHLKIGRTSMISGRLVTSMSQNFDVLSTFCGRKYVRLDVIQNTGSQPSDGRRLEKDGAGETGFAGGWPVSIADTAV